jgi:uncharacterized protein
MNRLAAAHSTYLRQHAGNPVDWWEWGADAFAEARRRNVPVLLSVGYASCHWCHVMAHESFEDADTAEPINRDFVAIKVDREERPDIDAIYMTATQALTGSGGWPMTCFLTPEGEPFYAGTYFPATPRSGMPSFRQVLTAVAEAWRRDPGEVRAAGARIGAHLKAATAPLPAAESPLNLEAARDALLAEIDTAHGGFGSAPKFPPPMALEFLLRHHERTGDRGALDAATLTLDRMARGGIYDQLAGGFARYSVDATWHVPHFEKMLTDNALLLRVYAHHARLTGSALSRRVARETGDFLLSGMRADGGGFIASLDADAGGIEGLTYRWPLAELASAVTAVTREYDAASGDAATDVLAAFGVDPARPDPEGEVLRLVRDPADAELFAAVRAELLRIRGGRPQPGRDDIVTLAGNGLAIAALTEAGALLGADDWIEAAEAAAEALTATCRDGDGWRRSMFHGRAGSARAGLADHGCLAAGLAALYQATGRLSWLELANVTLSEMVRGFRDADGGWFDVAAHPASSSPDGDGPGSGGPDGDGPGSGSPDGDGPDRGPGGDGLDRGGADRAPAIVRPRDPTDGAVPSGLSAAADALLTVSALTGDAGFREHTEQIATSISGLAGRFPRSAGWHLAVAEALAAGPVQIAVAGPPGARRDALTAATRRGAPGGAVIDIGDGDEPGRPLLADRRGEGGQAAAYVCRGFVCDRPTLSPADLERQLRGSAAGGV